MMEFYQFHAAPSGLKKISVLGRWIQAVSGFVFLGSGFNTLFSAAPPWRPVLIPLIGGGFCLCGIIAIALALVSPEKFHSWRNLHRFARISFLFLLGFAGLTLFVEKKDLLGIIPLVFLLVGSILLWIEKQSKQEIQIKFNEKGMYYDNGYHSRFQPWSSFNNVILRNNLLTLDLKNNQVIQVEVLEESSMKGETLFCQYCALFLSQDK
ncbi:MAG TPA: hypothetical protein VNE41_06760 [Chitinophagaceae bacterium]|nr:hypothetical protein [Chitinophagaceae bacterium]